MIPKITIYPFLLDSVSNVIKVEKAIQMCGIHRAGGESQYDKKKKFKNTYIWEEEMIQKKIDRAKSGILNFKKCL